MEEKAKRRATKKRVELTSKGGGQFQKGKKEGKSAKKKANVSHVHNHDSRIERFSP